MLTRIPFLTLALILTQASDSKTYVPQSDDVILATDIQPINNQSKNKDIKVIQKELIELLTLAKQPGESQKYLQAQKIINGIDHSRYNTELWYQKARIDQYLHHFEQALLALQTVFKQSTHHINGRLMAARLALMQRQPEQAKSHCLKLMNHADIMTVNICLLESMSYLGQLEDSYRQLSRLVENTQIPESHQNWVSLMLADMAQRLGHTKQVAGYLDQNPDFNNSAYLIAWADAHLVLNESDLVYKQLSKITAKPATLSSGLILRLAVAEKQSKMKTRRQADYWQNMAAKRVERHILRDDTTHASDVAYFFINLQPNPDKAKHWAQLNWQQAKEFKDEQLLSQANAMNSR